MRWVFPDPNDREETAAREAVRGRIDAWWKAFEQNAAAVDGHFSRAVEFDIVGFIQDTLQKIDDRLMWEFGPGLRGKSHRLAISPESDYGLLPMASEIIKRAPDVPAFEFYLGRPAESAEWAVRTVEGRVGVDARKASIRVDVGEGNRVDTLFFLSRHG